MRIRSRALFNTFLFWLLAEVLLLQLVPAVAITSGAIIVTNTAALDTKVAVSAYNCAYSDHWSAMFPTGKADSGTWAAWDSGHYAQIVDEGHGDAGALHMVSVPGKNTGVAINAGMTAGQTYTLSLWAKGTSNSGRVLAQYANGDPVVIGTSDALSADWKYYEISFTAGISQLNIVASDWGNTSIYIDQITVTDSNGNSLLNSNVSSFCYDDPNATEPEETEPEIAEGEPVLSTVYSGIMTDAYSCLYENRWVAMFPTGTPDNGTWAAWDRNHYGEVVEDGYNDLGALHLVSQKGVNTGVAINPGLIPGQSYTLGMWVKGTYKNGNRVLALYANGDNAVIDSSNYQALSSTQWNYFEIAFTASVSQLNLLAVDYGNTDLYIDNITLKDSTGKDLLAGNGDFYHLYRDASVDANFDFEDGAALTGWNHNGVQANSTMTVWKEHVYSGDQAMRVHRTKGKMDVSFLQSNAYLPVYPGDRIEFVAHIASRNCVSGHFSMYLYGYAGENDSSYSNAGYSQERILNAGDQWSQWDTYEMTYIVPAGVNYVRLGMRVGGTNADVLIDDIQYYNYTESGNVVYTEDFKKPAAATGLCGGWHQGEKSGTASTEMNGGLVLRGEGGNAVYTDIYSLMTDGNYTLTAEAALTDASGQLVLEAVDYKGSVTAQSALNITQSGELKETFTATGGVYYRLTVKKTEGSGTFVLKDLTIRRNQNVVPGNQYTFTSFTNFTKTVSAGSTTTFQVGSMQPKYQLPSCELPVNLMGSSGLQVSVGTLVLPEAAMTWLPGSTKYNQTVTLQMPKHIAAGTYKVQLASSGFMLGTVTVNAAKAPELTTTSSVEVINGRPTLLVNGEAEAPMWYARPENPYLYEEHTVTRFADAGVDTVVSYVFLNNNYGDVWTQSGFSSEAIDAMMGMTLAGNPDAKMVVAIDVNAPAWWCEQNPNELAALASSTPDRTNASFASSKWKEESAAIVRQVIGYLMKQSYANQIIGFKMTGGYTLEWNWWATTGTYDDVGDFSACGIAAFRAWLTEKYSIDSALQQAWGDSKITLQTAMPPSEAERSDDYLDSVIQVQTHPKMMDYELYMAQQKADTIEYFCRIAKEETDDRLIVGTYGGYFYSGGGYEFSSAVSNVCFQRMLRSEYIDFIKSPWMYGMREIGYSAQFMGPVDSLDLYGKLWIVEDDTRMNLREMTGNQDERAAVGWTRNYHQSVEQLKRNFSYVLSKGMGISFYNLVWNFTDDDQYYGVISQMYGEMEAAVSLPESSTADIAVFVDGESQILIPYEDGTTKNSVLHLSVYQSQLEELALSGAPYDMYLLDDLKDGLVPEHKINIFLGTTLIDDEERRAIESQLKKNGNYLIFIFTAGISDGKTTDISLMEDLIGMDLKIASTSRREIGVAEIRNTSHWLTAGMENSLFYGAERYDELSPVIEVADSSASRLAYHYAKYYWLSPDYALAVKDMGDWTSIYSAVPNLPQGMIRNVLKQAGCHIFTESGSDVVYASSDHIALHSIFAGDRTVSLPDKFQVYDVFSGQTVAADADSFTVTLSGKETRLFRLIHQHTVVTDAAVAATLTATGLTEGKHCSTCGEVIAAQEQTPALSQISWNMTLTDELTVNLAVHVDASIAENTTVTVSFDGERTVYNGAELPEKICVEVSAAQMADAISLSIVNGEEAVERDYSVAMYAEAILQDKEQLRYHGLVQAMLNYGGAAQTYFDYNTENLVSNTIGAYAVPEEAEAISIRGSAKGIAFLGASLVYRHKIAVRFYYAGSAEGIDFGGYEAVSKDGMYYTEIDDILPQNIDQPIEMTITDASGNALSVVYSPMNYIVRMNQKGSQELKALLKALYHYHLAAKNLSED